MRNNTIPRLVVTRVTVPISTNELLPVGGIGFCVTDGVRESTGEGDMFVVGVGVLIVGVAVGVTMVGVGIAVGGIVMMTVGVAAGVAACATCVPDGKIVNVCCNVLVMPVASLAVIEIV
jgi:hypothetical protein